LASLSTFLLLVGPAGAAQTITVRGTTNLAPLVAVAATEYQSSHPGVAIDVKGNSSGAGIAALKDHSADVAMSDVAVSDPDFVDTILGVVGFAFMVNPDVGITNLTQKEAIAIYSGQVTNWKQIGGNDQKIVLIGRDIGTGTRFVFEDKVAKTTVPLTIERNAVAVVKATAATPGAIGYLASGFIGDEQKLVISYEGIAPTPENIRDHTYPFATDEHLYVLKGAAPEVSAFVAFVRADTPVLRKNGVFRLEP